MKDWKITVSGKSDSAEHTEELTRELVRQARVHGLKVEEAQITVGGNTSSIGVDEPGMSRESALGGANHPDPLAHAQRDAQVDRSRETDAQRTVREAQERQTRAESRDTGREATRSHSQLSGDTTKR